MKPCSFRSSQFNRGYAISLLSAAILSTTAIFIRHLTLNFRVPALVLAFWRDVFVVITLLPVMALFSPALLKVSRKHRGFFFAYGLGLAIFNTFWTVSVARNGAAIATVLVYSSAAFSALLGRLWMAERLGPAKLVAVVLSFFGCALISGVVDEGIRSVDTVGLTTGILSGLAYALYSLMGRAAGRRGVNCWTSLLFTFGWASVFLFLFNLFGGLVSGPTEATGHFFELGTLWLGWTVLFLLAAGPTVTGFGLYNLSLVYLPASVANLLLTIEPVFTTGIAYLFLGERLTTLQMGGGLLILAGIGLLRIQEGDVRKCAILDRDVHFWFSRPKMVKPDQTP